MNLQRWTSAADNATSARTGNRKSIADNGAATQSSGDDFAKQSDQQKFAALLSDLEGKGDTSQSETAQPTDGEWPLEGALADEKMLMSSENGSDELLLDALERDEHISLLDRQKDSGTVSGEELGEQSVASDLSGLIASPMEANGEAHSAATHDSTTATRNTLPVNEAAARIIEEMQTRARRSEVKRWQFTLPGLLDGPVLVTVERLEDQSWVVDLSTPDGCSDEDRLLLEHRISARLGDVTLSTSSV